MADFSIGLVIPKGIICMWKGTIATIPSGWVFCNGANGTPDLRDWFIVGARQDDAGIAKTNVEGALYPYNATVSHSHGGTTAAETAYLGNTGAGEVQPSGGGSSIDSTVQPHDHDIAADRAIPPYYALAYIMKL